MWLGITFVGLGLVAVVLQAWLWRFPMVPDPGGPDPNGKSTAPRRWVQVHRVVGLAFVVIYVIMMIDMVPRLWRYQVELPARTIVHACMGITIGVLLVTKIAIIRWFQHFGKALPSIGFGIMLCTVILAVLSIPYALRAHDFGTATTPEGLARVERLMTGLELDKPPASYATAEALAQGRSVLTRKCVVCHDLRTILRKPYTPKGWHRVVDRMLLKPQFDSPLVVEDVGPVTAYLVAITPDIRDSVKQKRDDTISTAGRVAAVEEKPAAKEPKAWTKEELVAAKEMYETECSQCHELEDVDLAAPLDTKGWREVVVRMVSEYDAEFDPETIETISRYLGETKGK